MNCWPRLSAFFVFASVLSGAGALVAFCSDKQTVLKQAQDVYYNLKANGLSEFSCQVSPDFDAAYKNIKLDTVGREQILPAVKKVQFHVAVGPTGAAFVSHQFGEAPATDEIAKRLSQITEGMEQILDGFFKTWSNLMINSPFSGAENAYRMEEVPNGYLFTGDEAKTHVVMSLNHDLLLSSMEVKSPDFEGILRPHFAQHEGGVVLESYEATYKTKVGVSQELAVKIQYQEIEGLALPKKIDAIMDMPQGRVDTPIELSKCLVKKN